MNSSANQISPNSHRREVTSRVANFNSRQVLPRRLGKSRPGPAASGREYAVNGPVYARWKAGHLPGRSRIADSPLIELRKGIRDGLPDFFGGPLQPPVSVKRALPVCTISNIDDRPHSSR